MTKLPFKTERQSSDWSGCDIFMTFLQFPLIIYAACKCIWGFVSFRLYSIPLNIKVIGLQEVQSWGMGRKTNSQLVTLINYKYQTQLLSKNRYA